MATKIVINLPVKNLKRSIDFFSSLGCTFNMNLTDDKGACLEITDDVYCMLLEEKNFRKFTTRKQGNWNQANETVISLARESIPEVDEIVEKAITAGGREFRKPLEYDWIYGRSFEDLDGHLWQVYYYDSSRPRTY